MSKAEVKSILDAPVNNKHRIMLSLIYACGLRRGELLNLTFTDIQSDRHLMVVRQAKGKKDRIVPLSDKVLEMLRNYYKMYKPRKWLFEGNIPGEQFSEQGLQSAFKKAIAKAEIEKPVTLHWLRHVTPRTCLKAAQICGTSRNFLVITAAVRLKYIRMSQRRAYKTSEARLTTCENGYISFRLVHFKNILITRC
ncbi:MAG TPA: tyrosine-type recombinase/integrase [Flavobacterium sp.]